ncbi:ABC transporter ATP-binding protein [Roseobacter sp. HKCCA0434]|uniref:ABC transporter ATP-binding protein n=1 Tax=Roseobacter sp. HKCCA0434 TaxID=3079297 RepID=UPI002905B73C|nr:ABC transporter ATP-binding protein [Roseobacter sp. HKCCA0434]
MSVALDITGLSAGYGGRPVLQGVSLRIRPGEAHCLLGANGAGKSTLIRAILGRVRPAAGTVKVDRIGLVPQDVALYEPLTVDENLTAFAAIAGVPRAGIRARVDEVATQTGLDPRMATQVRRLSGGWRRRVNIAAALLHRPALLILDEPTVGVDAEARVALHALLRTLVTDGLALLITTHDIAEAEALCDHAILLSEGRVALSGRIEELIAARFGSAQALTLRSTADPLALRARGFDLGSGRPVKLVADEAAGLAEVRALREEGLPVEGIELERPGLDRLRHATLQPAEAA